MGFLSPKPGFTDAYHVDGSGHEYHGRALKGAGTASAQWQIIKTEYTGDNWIIKFPNGSDEPKFIWDNVESYDYYILGTYRG